MFQRNLQHIAIFFWILETETCGWSITVALLPLVVHQPSDYLFIYCRLTTSFDEVSVYPIPAVLYMVKNLLQVRLVLLWYDQFNFMMFSMLTYPSIWYYVPVLYLCLCRCTSIPDLEEPEYHQHWYLVPHHFEEKVSNFWATGNNNYPMLYQRNASPT
jgi:hypothetical protein